MPMPILNASTISGDVQ